MAQVQKQFDQFHHTIKLGRFEENQTLREKRDIIRNKLDERLPGVFERHDEECPAYFYRDQGSYEMDTGTKPLDDDFDIDQGVYFELPTTDYPDPVVLKRRVHEALDGHTADVQIRRSCVTVYYQRDGEPVYHVDLAMYSHGPHNTDGKSRLAKGKDQSTVEYRVWEISDPEGLTKTIHARFSGADRAQFRRIVRYLKRWKQKHFPVDGNAAPTGIGLTICTYDDLRPTYTDSVAATPDDLQALRDLVRAMRSRFISKWDDGEERYVRRLIVPLPVEPGDDLFERMMARQMERFEQELDDLQTVLDAAANEVDPIEACKLLQMAFGDEFPVPEKEETATRHAPAIVSSSNSA